MQNYIEHQFLRNEKYFYNIYLSELNQSQSNMATFNLFLKIHFLCLILFNFTA